MSVDTKNKTKVPALPSVNGVADQATRKFLSAVKELMEVREGARGDPLDQAVTFRDLYQNSLLNTGADGKPILRLPRAGLTSLPADPNASADYTAPPAVANFAAIGAIANVLITFDEPAYFNHAYTEVWRSGADDLGTAVIIGTSASASYVDNLGLTGVVRY